MAPRRLLLWFFFWFGLTSQAAMMGVEAAMPWNKQRRRTTTQTRAAATPSSSAADDNTPGVPFLIERLGKEIYAALDRPKYKVRYTLMSKTTVFDPPMNVLCALLTSPFRRRPLSC
jgi:hypothetical protein